MSKVGLTYRRYLLTLLASIGLVIGASELLWRCCTSTMGWMPHGMCFNWDVGLLVVHVSSDAIIGIVYFVIPALMVGATRLRPDLFSEWKLILYLYVFFIATCALTHFSDIVVLWVPRYAAQGALKVVCAAFSVATLTVMLIKYPAVLASLPNPEELSKTNEELKTHIRDLMTVIRRSETSPSADESLMSDFAQLDVVVNNLRALSERLGKVAGEGHAGTTALQRTGPIR